MKTSFPFSENQPSADPVVAGAAARPGATDGRLAPPRYLR